MGNQTWFSWLFRLLIRTNQISVTKTTFLLFLLVVWLSYSKAFVKQWIEVCQLRWYELRDTPWQRCNNTLIHATLSWRCLMTETWQGYQSLVNIYHLVTCTNISIVPNVPPLLQAGLLFMLLQYTIRNYGWLKGWEEWERGDIDPIFIDPPVAESWHNVPIWQ